jgi:hypothetical protein
VYTTLQNVYTSPSTVAGEQFSCSAFGFDGVVCWGFGNGNLGADSAHNTITSAPQGVRVKLWSKNSADVWSSTDLDPHQGNGVSGYRDPVQNRLSLSSTSVCNMNGACTGDSTVTADGTTRRNWRQIERTGWNKNTIDGAVTGTNFTCTLHRDTYRSGDNQIFACDGSNTTVLGPYPSSAPAFSAPVFPTSTLVGGSRQYNLWSADDYVCFKLLQSFTKPTSVTHLVLECAGDNTDYQLGWYSSLSTQYPVGLVARTFTPEYNANPYPNPSSTYLVEMGEVAVGKGGGCAQVTFGLWCWGKWSPPGVDGLQAGYRAKLVVDNVFDPTNKAVIMSVHFDHVLYVDNNGIVRGWGANDHDQLNRGDDPKLASDPTGSVDI